MSWTADADADADADPQVNMMGAQVVQGCIFLKYALTDKDDLEKKTKMFEMKKNNCHGQLMPTPTPMPILR